ncbi:MAG: type II secretion system protein [Desulfobulbus propionicus]|nr:MAG: type II secretion system protein [Desulfobulbus propionicus]
MMFTYRSLHTDGSLTQGTINAENERLALRKLHQQGLTVVALAPQEMQTGSFSLRRSTQPTDQEVHTFVHQLCTLLEAGIGLKETMSSLAEASGHPVVRQAFAEMSAALRKGASFSAALRTSKLSLPDYFYTLAEAGELTGDMAQALQSGLAQWSYSLETRQELKSTLTYPLILIFSGIGAVGLIFSFVIPRFTFLLEKGATKLPAISRIVLQAGVLLEDNMVLVGSSLLLVVFGLGYLLFNKNIRKTMRNTVAAMPFLRDWLWEIEIAQWAGMLGTLLENKVSLLGALELAEKQVRIAVLRTRLTQVTRMVRNGQTLAESLLEMSAITATGYNLIAVGEQSATLPDMLRSLAALYTQAWKNRTRFLLKILEPTAILLIGAMVGLLMGAIIMAITSVNEVTF